MLKNKFLRRFLVLSLLIAVVLPLYEVAFIHPSYRDLLVEETEDEASRYAGYLVRTLGLDRQSLAPENIPDGIADEVGLLQDDARLVKLRVFGPNGEIVYSTVPEEIGKVNEKPYFQDIVARGEIYSKVVVKDGRTAENQPVKTDLVETYVPVMGGGRFHGAIEIYYDITENRARVAALTRYSLLILAGICGSFLLLVLALVRQAYRSTLAREEAEEALRQANDQLEARVAERTGQLLETNRKLKDEIAERTLAQMALSEALAESEEAKEKIKGILSSVEDGLLVTDGTDRVVLINPAAETLLGRRGPQVIGRPVLDILGSPDLRARVAEALERGEGGQHFDFERPGRGSERPRVYQGRTFRLLRGQGSPAGLILLMQDVTREREVERMKSEFLAMAAHELHTPLTTIIGYTELLTAAQTEEFSAAQKREFLGYLLEKANALARIVDDLLDISRIEAGRPLHLRISTFVLDALLERVVGRYREACSGHSFDLALAQRGVLLAGDRARIEQVLENLLANAVKYSPRGGEIDVLLEVEGGLAVIRIRDRGIGLSAQDAERIFQSFYRVDASDTGGQGTGLGLSIARHIVAAHGGGIEVESAPGEGATFSVRLPLAGPEGPSAARLTRCGSAP